MGAASGNAASIVSFVAFNYTVGATIKGIAGTKHRGKSRRAICQLLVSESRSIARLLARILRSSGSVIKPRSGVVLNASYIESYMPAEFRGPGHTDTVYCVSVVCGNLSKD